MVGWGEDVSSDMGERKTARMVNPRVWKRNKLTLLQKGIIQGTGSLEYGVREKNGGGVWAMNLQIHMLSALGFLPPNGKVPKGIISGFIKVSPRRKAQGVMRNGPKGIPGPVLEQVLHERCTDGIGPQATITSMDLMGFKGISCRPTDKNL